jgi:transcriptional antiterminator NusG
MSDEHAKPEDLTPPALPPEAAVEGHAPAPPPTEPPAPVHVESVPEPADAAPPDAPAPVSEPEAEPSKKDWYIVKIQSGREESIKNAIERRIRIEGLEEFFGEIRIPTENVVEMRDGKRKVKKRKLFPGYLMTYVEYNDRILYLFRETSGVGDFVGGGVDKAGNNKTPTPMSAAEIDRILKPPATSPEPEKVVPSKPPVDRGDRVRVKEGAFVGMEGEVKEILEAKGQIRVELTIFGRPVPIELEYWAVDRA